MRHHYDENEDMMVTEIKEVRIKMNDIEYGKVGNIRFDAKNDIILCSKAPKWPGFVDSIEKQMIMEIKLTEIS